MYNEYFHGRHGVIKMNFNINCVLIKANTNNNNEPVHDISNNVVCATSKGSDQPAHTHSLIRALASRLSIL